MGYHTQILLFFHIFFIFCILFQVCLAKTVQSASLADSEADLLGLESAAPIISVPGSTALNLPILPLAPQSFRHLDY